MGNLIVHYGSMFSGKTTALIKAYGDYTRQGIPVICLKPQLDSPLTTTFGGEKTVKVLH